MKRLIFALVLLSSPAAAMFFDGQSFADACRKNPAAVGCANYVAGVVDASTDLCLAPGVETPFITKRAVNLIDTDKRYTTAPASYAVRAVILEVWPC
jgi:hypothetical protein